MWGSSPIGFHGSGWYILKWEKILFPDIRNSDAILLISFSYKTILELQTGTVDVTMDNKDIGIFWKFEGSEPCTEILCIPMSGKEIELFHASLDSKLLTQDLHTLFLTANLMFIGKSISECSRNKVSRKVKDGCRIGYIGFQMTEDHTAICHTR